jgi:hypothetical protein
MRRRVGKVNAFVMLEQRIFYLSSTYAMATFCDYRRYADTALRSLACALYGSH